MNSIHFLFFGFAIFFLSACSQKSSYTYWKYNRGHTTYYSDNKNDYSSGLSWKAYQHPTMRPYKVHGVKYYPHDTQVGEIYRGNASWYGPKFHGKLTSNGERYNMYDMTAAHKTLPMNTVVKVTNLKNGLNTVVRINDRGPFIETRIIDLSNTAARKIGMLKEGTAPVKIEVLGFYSKNKKKINRKKTAPKEVKKVKQDIIPREEKKQIKYSLQIASFENIDGAIKTQEKYDKIDGYTTIIKDVKTENGRLFKVFLNGFKTEEEARNYKKNSQFSNSFIVKN